MTQIKPLCSMKKLIAATIALLSVCILAPAQNQGMDKELAALGEKLAAQVKESGKKKVTVLDFTDLQGNTSDLGRFIAEELSVLLVERRSNFSVMDRANLKTILAQHKLTTDGLVEPENAKKLGQFSGVDAIILGKVNPFGVEVRITALIIATDTAENVGSARGSIPMGKEIEHLLSRTLAASPDTKTNSNSDKKSTDQTKPTTPTQPSQKFGNLSVTLDTLRGLNDGSISVNLILQNTGEKNSIAVAMYVASQYGGDASSSLVASDGTEFKTDEMTGLRLMHANPANLTEIEPGGILKATIKYRTRGSLSGNLSAFRLQAELVLNPDYSDNTYPSNYVPSQNAFTPSVLPSGCKIHNLVMDIPVAKRK